MRERFNPKHPSVWMVLALGALGAACADDERAAPTATSNGAGASGSVTTGMGGSGATTSAGGTGSGATGGAGGAEPECDAIEETITLQALTAHLDAFQTIADDHGGHRAAGSTGFVASVAYVTAELEAGGYTVSTMPVTHPYFEELGDDLLERTAPSAHTYVFGEGTDTSAEFQSVSASPPGDVTAGVEAVDLQLGLGNAATSGCESADFASFTAGSIALIQRGTCPFQVKVANAEAAGAAGVLLFNQGNTEDRKGLMANGVAIIGSEPDHGISIPVVFATYGVGETLATMLQNDTVTIHLKVDALWEVRTSDNVIAETSAGEGSEVVMLGAHLDSVTHGPGINDNVTGTAALLEIARAVAPCRVARKIRVAFWTAEEQGLWGSADYVFGASAPDPSSIHMYLNADMIGSPNAVYFIYDGDGSSFGVPGPEGSAEIEKFFEADFLFHGLPSERVFTDRSDHFLFHLAGVAYGGLFTGAEGIKTPDEAAVFGGTEGEAYDPCYHGSCDTKDNVDHATFEAMTKSLARATQFFGVDGESVPPSP